MQKKKKKIKKKKKFCCYHWDPDPDDPDGPDPGMGSPGGYPDLEYGSSITSNYNTVIGFFYLRRLSPVRWSIK